MLKAVVFDLDDTLYPERAFVYSGFRAVAAWVAERTGVPIAESFSELYALFAAGQRHDIFDRWLIQRGFTDVVRVEQLVEVYRSHRPTIAPYPDAPPCLARTRLRRALLTDGYLAVQQRKVEALGIEGYFEVVVYSDTWGREAWKPSPRPFAAALEQLAVAGPEAVYVADNPTKDFLGARQLGMWTVRVRRPDGLYQALEPPTPAYAPHVEIQGLTELEALLMGFTDAG
jgi:putative hydrolase of the HAD superfamily